jgi:hypothetical protein
MPEHDAEYFRRRRRAQKIPAREPFSTAKYIKRGLELKGLEQLPWPRNLFGAPASIAELMAEAASCLAWASVAITFARAGVGGSTGTTCRKPYVARTATASMSFTSGQTCARANGTGKGWGAGP